MFFAYCRIVATDIHFIACMRYRRGRPKGVPLWEFRKMLFGENAIRRTQAAGRSQQAVHRTAFVGDVLKAFLAHQALTNGKCRVAAKTDSGGWRPATR